MNGTGSQPYEAERLQLAAERFQTQAKNRETVVGG